MYLGQAPICAEVGDIVAVVAGPSWPCLLLESDANVEVFELVEPCFIHGIMDGELVIAAAVEKSIPEDELKKGRDEIFQDITVE